MQKLAVRDLEKTKTPKIVWNQKENIPKENHSNLRTKKENNAFNMLYISHPTLNYSTIFFDVVIYLQHLSRGSGLVTYVVMYRQMCEYYHHIFLINSCASTLFWIKGIYLSIYLSAIYRTARLAAMRCICLTNMCTNARHFIGLSF